MFVDLDIGIYGGCGNNRSGERVNDDTVIITMMVIKSKLH